MPRFARTLLFAFGIAVGSASGVGASDTDAPGLAKFSDLSPELAADGWQQLRVKTRPVAQFQKQGAQGITVRTENGAGFLYRALNDLEARSKLLHWSWRVESAPAPTDLAQLGKDDRPLAIHVWFPVRAETASLWQAVRSGIGNLIDMPVPGKVLTYVWGGTQITGTQLPNPYLPEDGAIIVLRGKYQETGHWQDETVNFAADYQAHFGHPAPPAGYLVISADTDDQAGRSAATVRDVSFER